MSYDDDELERMRARREQRRNSGRSSGTDPRRSGNGSSGPASRSSGSRSSGAEQRRSRGSEADDYDVRRSLGDSGRRSSGGEAFRSGYSGPRNGSGKKTKEQRISSGRRRRPDKKKRMMILAAEIAVLVVLVVGAGLWYVYQRTFGSMGSVDFDEANVTNLDLTDEQLEGMKGYMTVACFGVDSRTENGKMNVGKGTNADVNLIANINLETGEIRLVSVFRDTYLNISDKNSYNKINAAYAQGGPEQAVKALNKNLGLNITQYATFNWKAVADAINILDGVDIEISEAEFSWINAYITETVKETGIPSTPLTHAGQVHLDGVQAVAYGRLRLGDTDYARTERQRIILNKAFEKAKTASWADLNNILQTVMPQLATNIDLLDLIPLARNISKYHMGDTTGFPSARGEMDIGKLGDCVVPQTLESNVKLLHSFLFDEDDYQLPSNVKSYSNHIIEVTGLSKEAKAIGHVPVDQGLNASSYVNRQIKKQEQKAADAAAATRTVEETTTEESTEETEESSTADESTGESSTGDDEDWGDDYIDGEWDDEDWDNSDWNGGPGSDGPGSGPSSQTKPTRPTQPVKPGEKPTQDPDSSATGPGMSTEAAPVKKPGSSDVTEGTKASETSEASGPKTNNNDKTNSSTMTTAAEEEIPAGPSGPGA